jgi:hypothetical protein
MYNHPSEVIMHRHSGFTWVCILGALTLLLACNFLSPTPAPKPPAEYDPAPSALILEALHNNGFPSGVFEDGYTLNYIPHARIWGDGRILWVGNLEGPRMVWQGQLDAEQMTSLLQGIIDKGFFGWKGVYSSPIALNNPPFDVLTVNLKSVSHQVRVIGSPPEGFDTLFYQLRQGAGAEKMEVFVPAKGFLTAHPTSNTFSDPLPTWEAEDLGFTLAEVGDGKYISGAALEFAWEQVNRYPYAPAYIQSDSQAYAVYLQIPGVSLTEPPAERPDLWVTPQATPSVTDTPESVEETVVSGGVLIEDGRSAMGGTAGDTIQAAVTFTATSSVAEVIEMRVSIGCDEEALAAAAWEPFASQKTYPVHVILNWVGWYIGVQYRDASGNVSPMYCDDISVEGMPAQPTP